MSIYLPLTSNLKARDSHTHHTRALKHAYVSKQMHTREYLNTYMCSIHAINTRTQCVNTPIWVHTCERLKRYTSIMNLSLMSKLCVTHAHTCTDKLLVSGTVVACQSWDRKDTKQMLMPVLGMGQGVLPASTWLQQTDEMLVLRHNCEDVLTQKASTMCMQKSTSVKGFQLGHGYEQWHQSQLIIWLSLSHWSLSQLFHHCLMVSFLTWNLSPPSLLKP